MTQKNTIQLVVSWRPKLVHSTTFPKAHGSVCFTPNGRLQELERERQQAERENADQDRGVQKSGRSLVGRPSISPFFFLAHLRWFLGRGNVLRGNIGNPASSSPRLWLEPDFTSGAFCLDVRTLTFCQLMGLMGFPN